MWIGGRRRGGAKDLSNHLQKTEENESVNILELDGFSFGTPNGANLEKALKQMEAQGYAKKDKRNLYHAIVAPAYGETLNAAQRDQMLDYYTKRMGLEGHQRAVVEHWKHGKQHFHLVFNIIDPATGKTHELKWTKTKEWNISRGLERMFGFPSPNAKGKSAPTWAMQRGKRTGIDPLKVRKTITAIFHASKTKEEFVTALDKAGFALTRGRRNQLVLVDQFGDTHGLMRMIEGKKLADLRRKFPGIGKMDLPSHASLVHARKSKSAGKFGKAGYRHRKSIHPRRVRSDVWKAYRSSKSGTAFYAKLNRQGYALGRGIKGYAVIDRNGNRHNLDHLLGKETAKGLDKTFPGLITCQLRPASEIIRRIKAKKTGSAKHKFFPAAARATRKARQKTGRSGKGSATAMPLTHGGNTVKALFSKAALAAKYRREQEQKPEPFKPAKTKGWPDAALSDWAAWGHKDPARFFAKWPELASGNSSPMGGPS